MDTNGIRLFVLAADKLNISAAGRQLGLAPSVASARLSKLENELGTELLHRSTRKVSLSLEGAEFLPFAREILAHENAALAALGHHSTDIKGTLRFAASSTFAQLYVAPLLSQFLEAYPGIDIELKLSDTQVNIVEGGYDLALRNMNIADSSLRARKVANDKRILCASPEYLKSQGTPKVPEDLKTHQLLAFIHASGRDLISIADGRSCTFPPPGTTSRVICDDGTSMRIAAKAGAGICMSSVWSVFKELQNGSLVRVLPDFEIDDQSAIWLVYPMSNVLTPKVRIFMDFLLEKIGNPPIWEKVLEMI